MVPKIDNPTTKPRSQKLGKNNPIRRKPKTFDTKIQQYQVISSANQSLPCLLSLCWLLTSKLTTQLPCCYHCSAGSCLVPPGMVEAISQTNQRNEPYHKYQHVPTGINQVSTSTKQYHCSTDSLTESHEGMVPVGCPAAFVTIRHLTLGAFQAVGPWATGGLGGGGVELP